MRPWSAVALMAVALGAVACNGWPLGAGPEALYIDHPAASCNSGQHFQILMADLETWKTGYPGQQKGMAYPANKQKVAIRFDTCTGDAWNLRQTDDNSTHPLTTAWIPITQ